MKRGNALFLANVVWKSSKERYFWMIFACLLSLIPKFVSIYGLKLIVDLIVDNKSIIEIVGLIVILVSLEIINNIFSGIYSKFIIPKSDIKIKKYLNDKLFVKLSTVDLQCYDNNEFYENISLGIKDADKTVIEYFNSLQTLISNILGLIFIGSMIVSIDAFVVLAPLIAILFSLFLNLCIGRLTYKYTNEKTKKERYSEYIKRIFYVPSYAKEIIVFPIKKLILSEYDIATEKLKDINKKYSKKITVLDIFASSVFSLFGFGLILTTISWRIIYLQQGFGDFVALANASLSIVSSFMFVAVIIPELGKFNLFANNILNLLNYENEIKSPDNPIEFGDDYSIEYKNVSFAYPFNMEKQILNKVNIKIERNDKIAIVGFNGSGKTTFIKLLLRLYDVTDGEIYFGNNNINAYSVAELRSKFNVLFQDFQQFPLTISETVLMRKPQSNEDIEIVWQSLAKAGLKDKIMNCSKGLNSKVTKEFDEDGVVFSGGGNAKVNACKSVCRFSKNFNIR